jgi:hypothetical protein
MKTVGPERSRIGRKHWRLNKMIKGKQADFEMGGKPTGEDALKLVRFCLKHLWADNTKKTYEEAVYSLTWEEIVGAFMEAEAALVEHQTMDREQEEWNDKYESQGICPHCMCECANYKYDYQR